MAAKRPDRVPVLHRAASEWYAGHGLLEDAVGHALAGGNVERAADLVELTIATAAEAVRALSPALVARARRDPVVAWQVEVFWRSLRPLVASFVLVLGLACAWAFAGITIRENALAREITATQAQIAAEEAKQTQLEASAAEKQTADYIVERARSLGWVWPWEAMIAVEQVRADQNAASDASSRPSRIQRWIALFFGSR